MIFHDLTISLSIPTRIRHNIKWMTRHVDKAAEEKESIVCIKLRLQYADSLLNGIFVHLIILDLPSPRKKKEKRKKLGISILLLPPNLPSLPTFFIFNATEAQHDLSERTSFPGSSMH